MRKQIQMIQSVMLTLILPMVGAFASVQVGCATTQTMRSGSGVPASQGTITTKAEDNGNTKLSVRVKHLAPPARVAAGATAYVVWIQPRHAAAQNVGALSLDNNLEGRLDTVTPHRRFRVLVTPEPSAQGTQPTQEPVFTADVAGPN